MTLENISLIFGPTLMSNVQVSSLIYNEESYLFNKRKFGFFLFNCMMKYICNNCNITVWANNYQLLDEVEQNIMICQGRADAEGRGK